MASSSTPSASNNSKVSVTTVLASMFIGGPDNGQDGRVGCAPAHVRASANRHRHCGGIVAQPATRTRRYNRPMAGRKSSTPALGRDQRSDVLLGGLSPARVSATLLAQGSAPRPPRDRRLHGTVQRQRPLRARAPRRRRIATGAFARAARWTLRHGPFRRADFAALPARNWTLLVQGVNLVSADGDALLRPIRVPALRAPRRPDGELRRARRRRRPARRFLRRVPAAGLRPPPLAVSAARTTSR